MKNKNLTKPIVIVISVLLFLAAAISISGGWMSSYSGGEKIGIVVGLETEGIFFKKNEGTLMQSGTKTNESGSGVEANSFSFSTVKKEVTKDVKEALSNGKTVILVYKTWILKPFYLDSKYVVVDVKYPK